MSLVNAKCIFCGGRIQVDSDAEVFICNYCGTPGITEKAINNLNLMNNMQTKEMNANDLDTGSVQSVLITAEEYFIRAKEYVEICEWDDAKKCFKEARRIDPENGEYIFWGCIVGFMKMAGSQYVLRYPEIQLWEKDFFNSTDNVNYARKYFWMFFQEENNLHIIDRTRCEFILKHYPDVKPILPSDFLHMNITTWKSIEQLELLFQHDTYKEFNPYEDTFIEDLADCGRKGVYCSIYDLVLYGGKKMLCIYNPGVRILKELPSNVEVARLIERYYQIPEKRKKRFISDGECPYCHKRLSLLRKCKNCGRV